MPETQLQIQPGITTVIGSSGKPPLLQLYPLLGFGMGLPNVMGVAFAYMPVLTTIGDVSSTTMGGFNRESTDQELVRNIFGSSLMVSFLVAFLLNIIVPEDNSPAQ